MHRRETNLLARSGQQVASHATQPPENLGKLPMAGRGLAPKGSFLARLRTAVAAMSGRSRLDQESGRSTF